MGFAAPGPDGLPPAAAEPPSAVLPDGAALLALERRCRQQGQAVRAEELAGCWRLRLIWGRGRSTPAAFSSNLLHSLSASLQLRPAAAPPGTAEAGGGRPAPPEALQPEADGPVPAQWTLENSVRLGGLALVFHGQAWLEGRRPLLLFRFQDWRLQLGDTTLLRRSLPPLEGRRRPFFALIGSGPWADPDQLPARGRWLAARGRGGGLALWTLQG